MPRIRIREIENSNPPARYVVTRVAARSRENMIQFFVLGMMAGKARLYLFRRTPLRGEEIRAEARFTPTTPSGHEVRGRDEYHRGMKAKMKYHTLTRPEEPKTRLL